MSVAFFRSGRWGLALAGLLAATSVSSSTLAQPAQTVESAQKFLSITLPGARYMAGSLTQAIYEAAKQGGMPSNRVNILGTGLIKEYVPVAHCKSAHKVDYSEIRMPRDNSTLPADWRPASGTADFANLTSVKASGSTVALTWKGIQYGSTVYLTSESMAARVAVAFEFLRINCDPASDTGF